MGVGKSSFVRRFYTVTVGSHIVSLDDLNHKVECLQTAKNTARGFFILYSVTDKTSFHNLPYWFDHVKKHSSDIYPRPVIIVGCKADLEYERVVSYEEARDFADKRGVLLVEVSNKDGTNIEWAFTTLLAAIYSLDVFRL